MAYRSGHMQREDSEQAAPGRTARFATASHHPTLPWHKAIGGGARTRLPRAWRLSIYSFLRTKSPTGPDFSGPERRAFFGRRFYHELAAR